MVVTQHSEQTRQQERRFSPNEVFNLAGHIG